MPSHTHLHTRSVSQISKFLLASNLGDLLQFLVGAGGSTKEVFLEGRQTGGSGSHSLTKCSVGTAWCKEQRLNGDQLSQKLACRASWAPAVGIYTGSLGK